MGSTTGARLVGQSYTSAESASLLNRQAPLLRDNGGITFSGGEPLMQAAFLADTIDRLENLHVTLDTSGYASVEELRRVAGRCDLVLFDLKLMNAEAHRRGTGVDNEPILRNLALLAELGTPFIIRVPLVPGVTDTEENLRDAQRHPQQHKNLVVRVWGWSGYFCELDEAYQDQIIGRNIYGAD